MLISLSLGASHVAHIIINMQVINKMHTGPEVNKVKKLSYACKNDKYISSTDMLGDTFIEQKSYKTS